MARALPAAARAAAPVVERVLREFLKCGLVEHGFARLWCSLCRSSVLVAFSCRGRSFCPFCETKKQLLWAEWLREDVLLPVAHRHVVLTIPRLLRPLFRRRRELLGELARAGAEALKELLRHASGEAEARPGIVVSVASAGDLLQWHSHLHLITTDGGQNPEGSWHTPAKWDAGRLMRLFRQRLLGSLLDQRAISQELAQKLLAVMTAIIPVPRSEAIRVWCPARPSKPAGSGPNPGAVGSIPTRFRHPYFRPRTS